MNFSNGNSWDPKVTLTCTVCGVGKVCLTCHRHAKKRGECTECPVPKVNNGPVANQPR